MGDQYSLQRNQRLLVERSNPHLSNIGDLPRANLQLSTGRIERILLEQRARTILPEYLTSVGRKAPFPSPFGIGYNLEK